MEVDVRHIVETPGACVTALIETPFFYWRAGNKTHRLVPIIPVSVDENEINKGGQMSMYEQIWMMVLPGHAMVERGTKSFPLVSSQVAKYQVRLIRILEISKWAKVVH